MATNLKGQGGIKGLFLLHGEKLAIAIVGLIALMFVYKAAKVPRLEDKYQAPKLQGDVTQAKALLNDFNWQKAIAEFPQNVKTSGPVAEKSNLELKPDEYDSSSKFDMPVVASMTPRTDPAILNAEDPVATGGSGLFAFVDEKIRKEVELRRAAEMAEQMKREQDQQKKEELRRQREGNRTPGRNARGPEGPGRNIAAEIADPAHPKRRAVEGQQRALGIQLQGYERKERAFWACVVAKVPIRKQLNLYEDAFKNARGGFDQNRDFPRYVGYLVQRAEVISGKELKWENVPLYDGTHQSVASNKPIDQSVNSFRSVPKLYEFAQANWAGMPPDVIDQRFADYVLTLPLPPLVGRMWGKEATHPDIPLIADTPPLQEDTPVQQPATQTPAEPGTTDPLSGFSSNSLQPNGTPLPGAGPVPGIGPEGGFRRPMMGPEGGLRSMYGPEGGRGPGMGGPGMGGPGMGGRGMGPEGGMGPSGSFSQPGQTTTLANGVNYKLLRFFDYSVEPGKKYKYRVKLVLADPNVYVPSNMLASSVQDRLAKAKDASGKRKEYRIVEDWSDPTPTVGIPMAGNVLLADYKFPPPEKFNDEPSVTMFVESFDVDEKNNAIQAAVEKKDFRRGYVANFAEDAEYLVDGGAFIDTQKDFKFFTGFTLLDIDGGAKLTKDMNVPVRALVMGPSGQMYIRDEEEDKSVVEYHRLLFAKTNLNHRGPEGGPGGIGPEGGPRPRPPGRR
jgi:hypothetical protein